ncbi:MAG TPA: hypothetical protein VGQ81_13570 [Acidobacteriota bacterium]|jgi:hypothetical protein|nr:hypothetical protein [Acidobacteriota bacterium]
MRLRIFALVTVLLGVSSLSAQSLAELARKERERREKETKVPRVIRNEDLKNLGAARVTTTTSPAPTTPKAEAVIAGPGAPPTPEGPPPPPEDEGYWRKAFKEARFNLKLVQNRQMVLELRINDLRNRVLTENDGSMRTMIEQTLNTAAEELQKNKGEIAKAEDKLKKLEEEARKANVPPGWTREEAESETAPKPATPPAPQFPSAVSPPPFN